MMREGLAHANACLKDDEFFKLIDATGGWPAGYEYVGFEHTSERAAGFTNLNQNTGWWTTLNSQDDYYLWKLSPKALQRIVDAAISAARITSVSAATLHIKNSRGYKAELAALTEEAK